MLKAKHLSCAYGEKKILDQLSVELIPGEVLVLIGPNGAGKTTLMRAWRAYSNQPQGGPAGRRGYLETETSGHCPPTRPGSAAGVS
ncbi:MAG: ATP-binding cassette domain-containing protein [Planctomycetaceae bacterium]